VSAPPAILVVEDSAEAVEALTRAFRTLGLPNAIQRFATAEEAHAHLLLVAAGAAAPPALILVDLNLPGIDGRELVALLKAHDRIKVIPVIVLTSSRDPRDVDLCYRNGANAYMIKPLGEVEMTQTMARFSAYWLGLHVVLPARGPHA
jgi:CheY-like chemotaxis protein